MPAVAPVLPGSEAQQGAGEAGQQQSKRKCCKFLDNKVHIDDFVKQLDGKLMIYSKNVWSDLWLNLKNNHIILSAWMCHPEHTFGRRDRTRLTFMSMVLAFGLFAIFSQVPDSSTRLGLNIGVGVVFQGFYNAYAKAMATCPCIGEGCPACCRYGCLSCGQVCLAGQCTVAVITFFVGTILFYIYSEQHANDEEVRANHEGEDPNFLIVTGYWLGSKFNDFFFTSLALMCITVLIKRRKQCPPIPTETRKQMKCIERLFYVEEKGKAVENWHTKPKFNPPGWFKCWCCWLYCIIKMSGLVGSKAPDHYWHKYYGEDVKFEDLPDFAPQYKIDLLFTCCGCANKDGCNPCVIWCNWFRCNSCGGACASQMCYRPCQKYEIEPGREWRQVTAGGRGKDVEAAVETEVVETQPGAEETVPAEPGAEETVPAEGTASS